VVTGIGKKSQKLRTNSGQPGIRFWRVGFLTDFGKRNVMETAGRINDVGLLLLLVVVVL